MDNKMIFFHFIIVIAIFCITLIMAINNGMHHCIAGPLDYYPQAIGIAISSLKYNLGGYVGYDHIYETLISNGMNWDFHCNHEILNHAIQKALMAGELPSKSIYTFWVGDVGYIDYIRASFLIFGYKIESFLYLYFLLIFIQVMIFFLEFKKNNLAVVALIIFLLSHYVVGATASVVGNQLLTVHNYRFISVLGILPIMHICLLVLLKKGVKLHSFNGAFIQSIILLFAFRARLSAVWMIIMISTIVIIGVIYITLRQLSKKRAKNIFLYDAARMGIKNAVTALWPALLVIIIILPPKFAEPLYLNKLYYGDNTNTAHFPAMTVYIGMAFHPEINKIYSGSNKYRDLLDLKTKIINSVDSELESFDQLNKERRNNNFIQENFQKVLRKILDKYSILLESWYYKITYRQDDQDAYSAAFKWLVDKGDSEFKLFNFSEKDNIDYVSAFFWFPKNEETHESIQNQELRLETKTFNMKKDYSWKKSELILKDVVKEIIFKHPLKILELVLIIKPLNFLYNYYQNYLKNINHIPWYFTMVILTYGIFLLRNISLKDGIKFSLLLMTIFIFSMIIPLVFYTNPYVVSDASLILTMCIYSALIWLFSYVFKKVKEAKVNFFTMYEV